MADGAQRVAVVTGAARGIGAAIAVRLAADGLAVAVINHRPASNAAARCGLLTTTATLASLIGTTPSRCTMAHSTSGHRCRASASSFASSRSAISSIRFVGQLDRLACSPVNCREMPRNSTTAPAAGCCAPARESAACTSIGSVVS